MVLTTKKLKSKEMKEARRNKKLHFEFSENLEYEESELRLIIYQISIGISLNLIIIAIFISISILTMEFNLSVITPKITNQNQFGK